jgi:hypothetical protein
MTGIISLFFLTNLPSAVFLPYLRVCVCIYGCARMGVSQILFFAADAEFYATRKKDDAVYVCGVHVACRHIIRTLSLSSCDTPQKKKSLSLSL